MKLPIISPKKLIKLVEKIGFKEIRQKGSHKTFQHADGRILTIAVHSKPIPPGLLNKIIKNDLMITREEFLKKLK
ncbi:MAG: type II toxin-antitoxin system HicA family toxin [Candidatus Diapherotrites archaeon]